MTSISFSSSSPLSSAPPSPVSSTVGKKVLMPSKAKGLKGVTPESVSQPQLQQESKRRAPSASIKSPNSASPIAPPRGSKGSSADKKRDLKPETPRDMPAKKRRIAPIAVPKEDTLEAEKHKPTVKLSSKKRTTKRWYPENVIQSHRSPIAGADIRAILSHPLAWTGLPPSDRSQILAKFPDSQHILNAGAPDAAPNIASLRSDDNFRSDAALFSSHIAAGRLNALWLHDAWTAHERRRAGEFDDFEIEMFEEDWGIKLPEEMKGVRCQQRGGVAKEAATSAHQVEKGDKPTGNEKASKENMGESVVCGQEEHEGNATREQPQKVVPDSAAEGDTSEDEPAP